MKGLCCAAQAAGDLGKPLVVQITKKDGTTTQRCGVCEVRPSCSNQAKLVFAFRFLASAACGLVGASKCAPTQAGLTQYNTERQVAMTIGQIPLTDAPSLPTYTGPRVTTRPYTLPLG